VRPLVLQICAIGVVLLVTLSVIWMIRTLQAAKRCLEQVEQSFIQFGSQTGTFVQEASELLRASRELTQDIQTKAHALDSLFLTVRNVGDTVQQVTGSVNKITAAVNEAAGGIEQTSPEHRGRFSEAAKWIAIGMNLWQSRQARQTRKP
jgi:uncharacterized protein YoxC